MYICKSGWGCFIQKQGQARSWGGQQKILRLVWIYNLQNHTCKVASGSAGAAKKKKSDNKDMSVMFCVFFAHDCCLCKAAGEVDDKAKRKAPTEDIWLYMLSMLPQWLHCSVPPAFLILYWHVHMILSVSHPHDAKLKLLKVWKCFPQHSVHHVNSCKDADELQGCGQPKKAKTTAQDTTQDVLSVGLHMFESCNVVDGHVGGA